MRLKYEPASKPQVFPEHKYLIVETLRQAGFRYQPSTPTLNPYPAPCTLHPAPCTLNPEP